MDERRASPRSNADSTSYRDAGSGASPSSLPSPPVSSFSPSRGLKRPLGGVLKSDEPPSKRVYESNESPQSTARSSADGNESLRISNELLRGENEQLQGEVQRLKTQYETQFTQQKQRIRNLEEDLTRMYRRQKRDAEAKQMEHTRAVESLREQLERMNKQLEDRSAVDPNDATKTLPPQTTDEMDAFVAMCAQWQSKLTSLSTQLARQVAEHERQQVNAVMSEMVHKVAIAQEKTDIEHAQHTLVMQRRALHEQERDLELLADKIKNERVEMESFEALERRVLEDRVVEMETKLQNADENERVLLQQMAALRDELVKVRSGNHVLPQSEWQKKLEHEAHMKEQLEALTVQCEAQTVQLTLLREDLASLQSENDELSAEVAAHKQAAERRGDSTSAVTKQLEERIAQLKEQLAEAKEKAREAESDLREEHKKQLSSLHADIENQQNRVEVLTLNVEAKAKVIEGLHGEKANLLDQLTTKTNELDAVQAEALVLQRQVDEMTQQADALRDELATAQTLFDTKLQEALADANEEKLQLHKQMTSKTCDWVELNREVKELRQQLENQCAEVRRFTHEKSSLESQIETLRRVEDQWRLKQPELELRNKQLEEQQHDQSHREARVQNQLSAAESENRQLRLQLDDLKEQLRTQVDAATRASHDISLKTLPVDVQTRIAQLLVEKRAMETFLRHYFDSAEAKCRSLHAQVVELEAAHATHRQQARDSCRLLRLCTQVESCDGTIRASIQDAMTALERIT